MHIIIDYTPAVHQRAGIGRYTRGLVQALSEIESPHRFTLFVLGTPPANQVPQRLPPTFRLRPVPLTDRWATVMWYRLNLPLPVDLLSGRADLFHGPSFTLPPAWGGRGCCRAVRRDGERSPESRRPALPALAVKGVDVAERLHARRSQPSLSAKRGAEPAHGVGRRAPDARARGPSAPPPHPNPLPEGEGALASGLTLALTPTLSLRERGPWRVA